MAEFDCPLCGRQVRISEYLRSVFKGDLYALWAACTVTHVRHDHQAYYDRTWRCRSYAARNPEYQGHDQFKILVNNRAKRRLIRAAKKNFPWKEAKPFIEGFLKLQSNDTNTLKLINRILHINMFKEQETLDKYDAN